MKPDALALMEAVSTGERPRTAGERLGIHPKRVASLCDKWSRRGWYEYGVSLDLGWLTDKGLAHLAALAPI